jgi:hypothetical protein
MIRPEFRTILMDQRGAAVILWSFFMISVAVYLFIARSLLANPDFARDFSWAETVRIILWILTLVDLGYYAYWKKRHLTAEAILSNTKTVKLFRALETYKGSLEQRAAAVVSTYITRKVVVFAIIEAIAVYGLVLALAGRFQLDQYLLSGLSLILLSLEFPSGKAFAALVRAVEQPAAAQR